MAVLNLRRRERGRERAARATQEVVPYLGFMRPDLLLNKDGSLMAVYRFDGVDIDSAEPQVQDQAAAAIDHACRQFDHRITLWWVVQHTRATDYPDGVFASPVSMRLQQANRKQVTGGDLYANAHFLAVLYTPDGGLDKLIERFGYHMQFGGRGALGAFYEVARDALTRRAAFAFEQAQVDLHVRRFQALLDGFEGAAVGMRLHRLALTEALAVLHDLVNPASAGQPVRMPAHAVLDGWIADNQITVGAEHLVFEHPSGKRYACALSLKEWPDATSPGMTTELLSVPGEMTICHVFRFLDADRTRRAMHAARRYFDITQTSLLGYVKEAVFKAPASVDRGKAMLLDDAQDALAAVTADRLVFGYHNMTVLALGASRAEADETLKAVAATVNRHGFLTLRETLNTFSAWAGTLPGQWAEQPRRQIVSLPNLSDLAPIFTLWRGARTNPHLSEMSGRAQPALCACRTPYRLPYWLNLHHGDLAHTFLVGPTGSGKSVAANFLISQYGKYDPLRIIFDKNRSARIPTLLQDGTHIDIARERVQLNPMSLLADRKDWPWLASWLEILITSRGYTMTADDEKIVWSTIESLANLPSVHWRLLHFAGSLAAGHLADQLRVWCEGGALGHIFDNATDGFSLSDFTCIEMGELIQRHPRAAAAFMEYAFYRLDKSLDGLRPGLIYVEEAWFLLSDPLFARRLDDWLRTLRKKNTLVMLATQSLTELAQSEIFASLVDNVPNRIFLANGQARAHRALYRERFGLSDAQVDRIAGAIPKQHYYLVTPTHSRMLELRFDREALACLRSDALAQDLFDRARADGGAQWKDDYVRAVLATKGDL